MNEKVTQSAESARYEGLRTSENTLAILLDTRALIMSVRNSLLGKEFDNINDEWLQTNKPLMNEEGVRDFMRLLDSCIGIPQQLSGITEKEKKKLLRQILYTTIEFILFNKERYNIAESSFGTIYTIVDVNMTIFLNKAQMKTLIEFIKEIFGSREMITKRGESKEQEKNSKGTFWGFGGKK